MALGTTNISLNAVNQEFDRTSTQEFSLNDARLRAMAGAGASGTPVDFDGLRSKTGKIDIVITGSQNTGICINTAANTAGYDYVRNYQKVTLTINSGVTVIGRDTTLNVVAAISANVPASVFAYGVNIVNNGTIIGQGGDGGGGGSSVAIQGGGASGYNGGFGTPAIALRSGTLNITNNGIISGGGGGGGGGYGQCNRGSGYAGRGPVEPYYGGGGGGGGAPYGIGAGGGSVYGFTGSGSSNGKTGSNAGFTAGGAAAASTGTAERGYAGASYSGGSWAQNALDAGIYGNGWTPVTYNINDFSTWQQRGPGGTAGSCTGKWDNTCVFNWIATGTRYGAIA